MQVAGYLVGQNGVIRRQLFPHQLQLALLRLAPPPFAPFLALHRFAPLDSPVVLDQIELARIARHADVFLASDGLPLNNLDVPLRLPMGVVDQKANVLPVVVDVVINLLVEQALLLEDRHEHELDLLGRVGLPPQVLLVALEDEVQAVRVQEEDHVPLVILGEVLMSHDLLSLAHPLTLFICQGQSQGRSLGASQLHEDGESRVVVDDVVEGLAFFQVRFLRIFVHRPAHCWSIWLFLPLLLFLPLSSSRLLLLLDVTLLWSPGTAWPFLWSVKLLCRWNVSWENRALNKQEITCSDSQRMLLAKLEMP